MQVKQEPLASPPAQGAKPVVNKRKKRGASEELDRVCEVASQVARVKSEAPAPEPEQLLTFTPFQPSKWRETFNKDFQNLVTPALRVTADKGFNFSAADDAFIAQKKNHFQLSCCVAAGGEGEHALVTTERGCQKIEHFQLNFYGVKKEAPEQRIQVSIIIISCQQKYFYRQNIFCTHIYIIIIISAISLVL